MRFPIVATGGTTAPMTASPLSQRIREARKRARLSLDDVGKRLGVTRQAVSQWETGDAEITKERLFALPAILSCDPLWLFYGVGLPDPAASGTVPLTLRMHGGRGVPKVAANEAAADHQRAMATANVIVPVVFDVNPGAFALDVWDSRNSPDFLIGHRIVIDPSISYAPGDYVFVAVGKEARPLFGRLRVEAAGSERRQYIRADNPNWPEEPLDADSRIIGRLVEHVRPHPQN